MKFRPCIDLHKGKVKQIVGSTLRDNQNDSLKTNFESKRDPAFFAEMYRRDSLYGGHVIMLGSGNENAVCRALRAFPNGLQAGGGITPQNFAKFLDAGASHIIATSYMFSDGHIKLRRLERLSSAVGKKHLVVDLSCARSRGSYLVATNRWQKISSVEITGPMLEKLSRYCDEFLVHAVDIEGKMQGVDKNLIKLLAQNSPLPVTYAGGIRSFDDLEIVRHEGKNRVDVSIGSALDIFGGNLGYADVVAWHKAQQP